MTVAEVLQYYSDLLIIQYNDKPKAKATIKALTKIFVANNIIISIRDGFDLDTAIGKQLDILGKYIGADRFYTGTLFDKIYFGFSDETSFEPPLVTGYSTEADFFTKDGEFLDAEEALSESNSLNDDDYRLLLKLKVFQNNIDHSTSSIDSALLEIFGADVYATDNYNMTMTYFIPAQMTALIKAAQEKDILLRPMTVGINILHDLTYFGFADAENPTDIPDGVEGFSDPSDFLTKEGEFLGIEDIIT